MANDDASDEVLRLALANLHDAYLNASVVHDRMVHSPIDAEVSLVADRYRLERLWVALIAVLVESWKSKQMDPVRKFLSDSGLTQDLDLALADYESRGFLSKAVSTRHYMFHRDRRKYWNDGRTAPVGEALHNLGLFNAFGEVLREGIKKVKADGAA